MWTTEVDIHLANGRSLMDTSPGDAIMEVLGLYAEDDGIARWRREAEGLPVPHRPEQIMVRPRRADPGAASGEQAG